MHRYFAYGSNLEPVQMKRRCPSHRVVGRATLPGHRLVFPVRSGGDWGGGVAGIEPCDAPDATVHGVLFEVDDADLAALDRYEAVAEGMYRRERVTVHLEDGGATESWTYYATPDPTGPSPPSRRYLNAILAGARHHGLPGSYVETLIVVPTED